MSETPIPEPHAVPAHPPTSPGPRVDAWRSGKLLVVRRETHLPPRCLRCNTPVEDKSRKKDLYWHHPALLLTVLVGLLLYLLLALLLRRRARVHYYLCRECRRRRRKHIAVAWLLVLLCPALLFAGISLESNWVVLGGVLGLFAGLLYAVIFTPVLTPKRISDDFGWLKRAHPDFLATLPDAQLPG